MNYIKVKNNCYIVDAVFKSLLNLGQEFQGETIVKIENLDKENRHITVTTENPRYQI